MIRKCPPFIGVRLLSLHYDTPLDRLTIDAAAACTKVLITSRLRSSTENNRAIIYDACVKGTSLLHGYANDKRAPDRPAFSESHFRLRSSNGKVRPSSSSF